MAYSLAQAAQAVGRNRSTLLRMIKNGRLSGTRDEATGVWFVDPAELHRVLPALRAHDADPEHAPTRTADIASEIALLRARLDAASDAIRTRDDALADLRVRLDRAEAERRAADAERREAQAKLTAVITAQAQAAVPARRGWAFWRR